MSLDQLTQTDLDTHNTERLDAVEEVYRRWTEILPEEACNEHCRQGRRVGHVCKQNQPSARAWRFCDAAIFALFIGCVGAAILTASGVL
jgi:hypothetical protein